VQIGYLTLGLQSADANTVGCESDNQACTRTPSCPPRCAISLGSSVAILDMFIVHDACVLRLSDSPPAICNDIASGMWTELHYHSRDIFLYPKSLRVIVEMIPCIHDVSGWYGIATGGAACLWKIKRHRWNPSVEHVKLCTESARVRNLFSDSRSHSNPCAY
jgi:hypothetical protein